MPSQLLELAVNLIPFPEYEYWPLYLVVTSHSGNSSSHSTAARTARYIWSDCDVTPGYSEKRDQRMHSITTCVRSSLAGLLFLLCLQMMLQLLNLFLMMAIMTVFNGILTWYSNGVDVIYWTLVRENVLLCCLATAVEHLLYIRRSIWMAEKFNNCSLCDIWALFWIEILLIGRITMAPSLRLLSRTFCWCSVFSSFRTSSSPFHDASSGADLRWSMVMV